MLKLGAIVLAGLLAGAIGCRSTAPNAKSLHAWGWEDTQDAKAHLNPFKHIVLACIYEDHWEDQGPHNYALYHFKATVVRSYKGDWLPSEGGLFVEGLDYRAPTVWKSNAGRLVFLLTNQHTATEIALEPDEYFMYDPVLERVLQFLYPERNRR